MRALEQRRDETLDTLASHFAAGHVRERTLEHRVEEAIRARTLADLADVVWDLPPLRRSPWRDVAEQLADRARPSRISFRAAREIVIPLGAEPRTYVVGRSRSCHVVLGDPAVSRRHALLSVRGGRCSIRDLASTNGTQVNGRPVTTATLHAGDVVRFGGAVEALVR